jgi:hypothetical protein
VYDFKDKIESIFRQNGDRKRAIDGSDELDALEKPCKHKQKNIIQQSSLAFQHIKTIDNIFLKRADAAINE